MKLRKLHIENYKMFKDFDISFVDKDNKPLPIIVLAGVNGSGKTTLLEYIHFYKKDASYFGEIKTEEYDTIYFPIAIDDIKRIEEEFVKSFYFFLKSKDFRPSEVREHFNRYMQDIFSDLILTFQYSHLDRDDNVWFRNIEGDEVKIEDLSTGEKTLLSKVLYLFFKGYKDNIILIDEPELSLHPSWQNKVLKIYENFAIKNNCQIIIATHSPHIIGSAKAEYIRVLKKVDNKIEVVEYNQSYGLEFNQILTNIMGIDYLRTPDVAKKMDIVKDLIIKNKYDSNEFKEKWIELENILGKNYLDLKLLKLEIASRRKCASNN